MGERTLVIQEDIAREILAAVPPARASPIAHINNISYFSGNLVSMKNGLLLLTILLVFARCGQGHREGSFSANFTHQRLNEFPDTVVSLPSGTAIRILAYSGGDVAKKSDELYYCQFIGINSATRDTVRILAAAINVEEASTDGKPDLTPSSTYDFDKGITDATFKVPTENDQMMIKMMPELQGGNPTEKVSGKVDDVVKEYVMIPEGVPFFTRHFKTVAGILSFRQQPW